MTKKLVLVPFVLVLLCLCASAQVVINEIHYNPVELPAFDSTGKPVYQGTTTAADFTDDVHEFLELRNIGATPVDLSGWRLDKGVDYTFPNGTSLPSGGYLVVAKNPTRIQTVYGITGVLGPYTGLLSNSGDTIRLLTPGNAVVDSVTYGTNFPWAISANKLGADDEFTGLNSANYQYKGRSLQRVSASAQSNDPANWVAVSTDGSGAVIADLPTPGAVNLVTRPSPKPVVIARSHANASTGDLIIRPSVAANVTCTFSSVANLSEVELEYFIDKMILANAGESGFGETRTKVPMTSLGNGQYTATIPAQIARAVVRYRIRANRGDGSEVVSPRADDPAVVQVGPPTYGGSPVRRIAAPREQWYAYFVTPTRSSAKPIVDVIVPTDGSLVDDTATNNTTQFNGNNGLQAIAFDCKGSPKRTTAENTASSYPREVPYVPASDRVWDDVVPGIFAKDGECFDIQIRYHGSRWNRRPTRKSFKVFFPNYNLYRDGAGNLVSSVFETDKTDYFMTAHGLHQLAGLPLSTVRYVDWYFNSDSPITRLEQGEYNGELLDSFHEKQQRLNPGSVKEQSGELYKSTGYIIASNLSGEGPYGNGNAWPLPAAGYWTELQRYEFTYALQNHKWKGAKPIRDLIAGMWTARGDTYSSPNPNITNLRAWLNTNWDVDTELTSLALGNWMCPWDDTTQNHYFWRRVNGKWSRLLWDFDGMYGKGDNTGSGSSIYLGEVGLPSVYPGNNSRGPNYVKDSFIKPFRTEYKQRLWFLNNTLLDPENLQTLTYRNSSGSLVTYRTFIDSLDSTTPFSTNRFTSVNSQVGLGTFYKPTKPTPVTPTANAAVLPGASFTASAYGYNAAFTHAAAPSIRPHASSKWEVRAASSNYENPAYVLTSTTSLTTLPIPFDQLTYGQSYYWRVTYYDADGHPSITSNEAQFSYGASSPTAGNVTLNEVMADNAGAVLNGTDRPNYVELKNTTAGAIDLSGWNLTDDELVPTRYTFPANTSIPAGGYLVVWCDSNTTSPGLHSGFGLSRRGQRVLLIQAGVVRDAIAFGPQMPNGAIGRVADGNGAWTLVNPSPGETNTARNFTTNPAGLKFNEWMAVPASGSDWFEIYNVGSFPISLSRLWLSDTPATPKITQIPNLSFVAPGGCVRFDADGSTAGFSSTNFRLATAGDNLVLTVSDGLTTIHSITFGPQLSGISEGYFPDGSGTVTQFPVSASPGDNNWLPAQIRVNEVLASSVAPIEDYVELFNPTASTLDIGGWWLSDDRYSRYKYQIPAGTSIPAGGYLVLTESQFNAGANAFSLSSFGDEVVLTAADAGAPTGFRSQLSFDASAPNVPFGYTQTAQAPTFWPQTARTLSAPNSGPIVGPIIVNEAHYHPPDLSGADNSRDEYVELHNITTNPVDVSGWKLKGGVAFVFPANTVIRPGDYVLLVSFNPVTDTPSLNGFRSALNVPETVQLIGPYSPKLGNDSVNIELAYPGTAVAGVTPFINVDRVEYMDFAPWPVTPDGTGMSLQRFNRTSIGDDAATWAAQAPTPGAVNFGEPEIIDNDGDGLPNAWEDANGLDKFTAADAAADADADGQSNGAEYVAGTSPRDNNDRLVTGIVRANGGPGFVVSFPAKPGRPYVIEYKAQLSDATWQPLANIPAQASATTIQYTDPTTAAQRYYRVRTSGP